MVVVARALEWHEWAWGWWLCNLTTLATTSISLLDSLHLLRPGVLPAGETDVRISRLNRNALTFVAQAKGLYTGGPELEAAVFILASPAGLLCWLPYVGGRGGGGTGGQPLDLVTNGRPSSMRSSRSRAA